MAAPANYYPSGVKAEQWDGSTGLYTSWSAAGTQTTQRALTTAEAAAVAAIDAAVSSAANSGTIQANITTHIGQLEAWLTANPNGAVLTGPQTKFVAQTLIGLGRLMLGLTSTVGGAT